jgi:hypothetical protein
VFLPESAVLVTIGSTRLPQFCHRNGSIPVYGAEAIGAGVTISDRSRSTRTSRAARITRQRRSTQKHVLGPVVGAVRAH